MAKNRWSNNPNWRFGIGWVVCAFLNEITSSSSSMKSVDFEASLTHAKSNEIFSAGCEFAKKTWWFFYIDQSVVWVDVHVKTASRVNQFASVVSCFGSGRWAMDFPHKQPGNHILRWNV